MKYISSGGTSNNTKIYDKTSEDFALCDDEIYVFLARKAYDYLKK